MDLAQLEADLETALTNVISEEATLQAAIDAVKAVLPPAPDASWTAIQADLVANGWTAPTPAPTPAPEPAPTPEPPAPDA